MQVAPKGVYRHHARPIRGSHCRYRARAPRSDTLRTKVSWRRVRFAPFLRSIWLASPQGGEGQTMYGPIRGSIAARGTPAPYPRPEHASANPTDAVTGFMP